MLGVTVPVIASKSVVCLVASIEAPTVAATSRHIVFLPACAWRALSPRSYFREDSGFLYVPLTGMGW
ncbi:hypothetical protein HYQ46_004313 [Verticillium longisporum]|nr:hypothetical protein HYQ46_004313 [Verticillium longisporum]